MRAFVTNNLTFFDEGSSYGADDFLAIVVAVAVLFWRIARPAMPMNSAYADGADDAEDLAPSKAAIHTVAAETKLTLSHSHFADARH